MPPFRFNIPFFSYGSPSRLSSGNSSSSPPPARPISPSRPPFRPAGIAQPSKPATSLESKSKVPPSLSKVKSNVAATAGSSSASQSSSRGAATPSRLAKQSNQSGSPSKKLESLRAQEKMAAMKEKPSREIEKEAGEDINPVKEKPPIARAEEAHEQWKMSEAEKLAVEEKNSKIAQERQMIKETEKLAVEEKKKKFRKDMEENSNTAQEQHNPKEIEKFAMEEKNKVHRKDMGEDSKETKKLASQERNKALQNVGGEDATRSKSTRNIAAPSEPTRGPIDLPERKMQNRTQIHTGDNQRKTKSVSMGTDSIKTNEEGSSSMSRRIKKDTRDGISRLTWGKSNGDEKSVSVFTLTGENRGATMAINSEKDKKDGEVHIHRGYRSNPDESPNTTATETEGERRPSKGKTPKDEEESRVKAYMNGNTQGVNNSILCESSVRENDPGIHMSFRFEETKKEIINPPEKKSETVIETEKLRNIEPRVRRRCLRGLLAESSDSEPENPLKPRRHGCRFTCKDKDIENT